MNKYVVISFIFMGFVFYEMSGGSDFVPRKAELMAAAEAARASEAAAREARVAARTAPVEPAVTQPQIVEVTLREPAPVTAQPVEDTDETLAASVVAPTTTEIPVVLTEVETAAVAPTLISLEQSGDLFARPLATLENGAQDQLVVTLRRPTDIREVAGSRVNMRNGPGTGFGVLTSLPRGTAVEVIDSDGTGWVKLRTVDDQIVGWMAERLLTDPTG